MRVPHSVLWVILLFAGMIGIRWIAVSVIRESRLNVRSGELNEAVFRMKVINKKLDDLENRSVFIVWPEDKRLIEAGHFKFKPRYESGK